MKNKPIEDMIFRPVEGIWRNVSGDSEILADTLERLDIIIDDKTQFARIKDYDKMIEIWYRAYGAMKIRITVWKLNIL